jgi:hypothetical protein
MGFFDEKSQKTAIFGRMVGLSFQPNYYGETPLSEQFEAGEELAHQMVQQNPKLYKD